MATLPKHDPSRIRQDPAAPARNLQAWSWIYGTPKLDHGDWDFVDHAVTPQRIFKPVRYGTKVIRRAGR